MQFLGLQFILLCKVLNRSILYPYNVVRHTALLGNRIWSNA